MKNNVTSSPAMDWYEDRYQSIALSRNRWLVTGVLGLGLALAQSITLLLLLPLKTTVPFLVKEETSGAVTTVTKLGGESSLTYSEAVRKYFIGKYVSSRETYDQADLLQNYRAVELMSDAPERSVFHGQIATNNPTSPLAVYGANAKRYVRIKSISFLSDHSAQVRFTALERRGTSPDKQSDWIATLSFTFAGVSSSEEDRLINPLGFVVTSYRMDQEVLP